MSTALAVVPRLLHALQEIEEWAALYAGREA